MSTQPTTFNPPDVAPPKPTYSHVATTTLSGPAKLITIAGQVGRKPGGEVPSTYKEQVECALANLGKCLAAAGAGPRDIIKITHYIVNYDPKDRTRLEPYLKFMDGHKPPSTLIPVPALAEPEFLYEIEAMAVVQGAQ